MKCHVIFLFLQLCPMKRTKYGLQSFCVGIWLLLKAYFPKFENQLQSNLDHWDCTVDIILFQITSCFVYQKCNGRHVENITGRKYRRFYAICATSTIANSSLQRCQLLSEIDRSSIVFTHSFTQRQGNKVSCVGRKQYHDD